MVRFFHLPWSFSLLLGAIGCATAPASTMMTIRQYHAKGNFVDTILQVTALDDAVALMPSSVLDTYNVILPSLSHLFTLYHLAEDLYSVGCYFVYL